MAGATARIPRTTRWRRPTCRTGALLATCPHTLVHTEGRHVGLPDGQMGNSEVGHMNLGAGRIVYQDLTRVDAAIEDGSFFANAELNAACDGAIAKRRHSARDGPAVAGRRAQPRVAHLRDAGMAHRAACRRVAVHAFLDGRDTPPRSAEASLRACRRLCDILGNARIATVGGRYFAMDRDKRWDRVRAWWDAMVEAGEHRAPDALAALQAAYARGENDEFVAPT
jgi:2,3-bisphosphoglycerate-independent phosphoglycerate mutase